MDATCREFLQRRYAAHFAPRTRMWQPDATPSPVAFRGGFDHLAEVVIATENAIESARGDRVAQAEAKAFYQGRTAANLTAIWDCYFAGSWDIPPHLWEPLQVAEACVGVVPLWNDATPDFPAAFPWPLFAADRFVERRLPRVVYTARPALIEFLSTDSPLTTEG